MEGLDFEEQQISRVAYFYNQKSVFLTGASGFVGSLLLEALLRCNPGIKSIYILLRSKKNVQPEVRKEEIFSKKIFDKIKDENRQLLDKVHVIPGDSALPNLGMRDEDIHLLIDEVSIVFHCAAIINFVKPLKFMLVNNVLSLNTVIKLCRRMKKFEVLVYTSTAYSNCNHENLIAREEIYRLPFRAEKFIIALENEDDKKLQKLFDHCKPDWPNTYTFSKCLAENLIGDTASDLPVAIIRPSTVFSTWKHPVAGYVEENSGIIALSLGVGKGFIKTVHADPNAELCLIPGDVVANTHILAAKQLGTKRCVSPLVVNCTPTKKLQVTLSEYNKVMTVLGVNYPLPQSFSDCPHLMIVPNRFLYCIVAFYQHYLPGLILDGMLKITENKTRIISLYRFFDKTMSSLHFFMFHSFRFERRNMEYLDKLTHPEDKKDLPLDFSGTTLEEMSLNIPSESPFYDWKKDRKTPLERQNTKYRRHIIIKSIQSLFLMLVCALIYGIYSFFL